VLIFSLASNWQMTQLHYLLTDGWGGVAHCHACRVHIHLLIFLRSDSANCHILGCRDPGVGPITPKFELGRDFCTVQQPPSFVVLRLIIQKLSCWQTNRRHWKHTPRSTVLCRWVKIKISNTNANMQAWCTYILEIRLMNGDSVLPTLRTSQLA